MLCPQCGYLMSALDKDCARCRNFSAAPPPHSKATRPADNQIEWDTPPPQTMAFMPMNPAAAPSPGGQPLYGQPLNGQPLNNQPLHGQPLNAPPAASSAYAPQPAYTPYMPAPAAPAASEPSGASQVLIGALGALLIVGYVGLRVYLYEARQERKQAAMLDLNAHYNDTMRRQFDTMQMQGQTAAERAQQDVADAMRNGHGMSGTPSTTVFINAQSGPPAQQMMMQQQAQMQAQQIQMQSQMMQQQMQMRGQMMQQQQQMRDRMMQNHGGMGGGFGR